MTRNESPQSVASPRAVARTRRLIGEDSEAEARHLVVVALAREVSFQDLTSYRVAILERRLAEVDHDARSVSCAGRVVWHHLRAQVAVRAFFVCHRRSPELTRAGKGSTASPLGVSFAGGLPAPSPQRRVGARAQRRLMLLGYGPQVVVRDVGCIGGALVSAATARGRHRYRDQDSRLTRLGSLWAVSRGRRGRSAGCPLRPTLARTLPRGYEAARALSRRSLPA
jgi:hypothetical protein